MHMAENFDISTLTWVKGEIDETLKQARIALEAYVEDLDDEAQLRFCTTYLHQVSGTLRMVELNGAAQFADEMELFAVGLLEDKVEQSDESFELLMRSILQLPYYLEGLQHGQADNPLVLLPVMNELREKRGAGRLSEAVFFRPDLSVKAPGTPAENAPAIDVIVKKLRPYLQTALLNILRDREIDKAFKAIELVFDKLLQTAPNEHLRQWVWVGSGYVEALHDGHVALNKHAKTLLGKFDQILRSIAADGTDTLNVTLLHEMVRALLYQIAKIDGGGQRIQHLKSAFSLEKHLPSAQSGIKSSMGGIDEELRKTVATDVMDELSKVKDSLDIFVRSDRGDTSSVEGMAVSLVTMAETLKLLGEDGLANTVREQSTVLRGVLDGSVDSSDETMMGVASAVLAVETALGDWGSAAPLEKADDYQGQVSDEETTPEAYAEHNRVIRQVMKESRDDLIKIREAISQYLQKPQDKSILENLPAILHQSIGSLSMLSYRRVASVLQSCSTYIRERLIESSQMPEAEQLDSLADAIMSIEYYLEAFVQSKVHPSSVLEVAEQAVDRLGYPAESQTIAEVEPIVVEAPAPELVGNEEAGESLEVISVAAEMALDEETAESAAEPLDEVVEPEAQDEEVGIVEAVVPPAEAAVPVATASVSEANVVSDIDEEILEIFIEEATEEFEKIAQLLPQWIGNPTDLDTLRELRRSYHTIKGSGRLVGATDLGEFAWAFENMLNRIIDGTVSHNNVIFDILMESQEAFVQLLEQFKGGPAPTADVEMLHEAAEELSTPGGMQLGAMATPVAEKPESPVKEQVSAGEEIATEISLDPVLLEIYANETESHLDALDAFIETARSGGSHKISEPLIRALHTLTGSSRMAGIAYVGDITSVLEKYAKTLQGNGKSIDAQGLDVLAEASEFIKGVLVHLQDSDVALPERGTLKNHSDALYLSVEHMAEEAMAKPEDGLARQPEEPAGESEELAEGLVSGIAVEAVELEGIEFAEGEASAEEPVVEEAVELEGIELAEGEAPADEAVVEESVELEGIELAEGEGPAEEPVVEETFELEGIDLAEGEGPTEEPVVEETVELESIELAEVEAPVEEGVVEEAIELEGIELAEVEAPAEEAVVEEAIELEGFEFAEGEAVAEEPVVEESVELEGIDLAEGEGPAEEPVVEETFELEGIELAEDLAPAVEPVVEETFELEGIEHAEGEAPAEEPVVEEAVELEGIELAEGEAPAEEPVVEETVELEGIDLAEGEGPTEEPVVEETVELESIELAEVEAPAEEPVIEEAIELEGIDLAEGEVPAEESVIEETIELEGIELAEDEGLTEEAVVEEAVELEGIEFAEGEGLTEEAVVEEAVELEGIELAEGEAPAEEPVIEEAIELEGIEHAEDEAFAEEHSVEEAIALEGIELAEGEAPAEEPVIEEAVELEGIELAEDEAPAEESVVEEAIELEGIELAEDKEFAEEPSVEVAEEAIDLEGIEISPQGEPEHTFGTEGVVAASHEDLEYDEELLDIFLDEGREILDASEETLQAWVDSPEDLSLVQALQRQLHTLKGGARMAGVMAIGDLSHSLESTFEDVIEGRQKLTRDLFNLLQLAHDRLAIMLEQVSHRQSLSTGDDLIAQINALAGSSGAEAVPAEAPVNETAEDIQQAEVEITPFEEAETGETEASTSVDEEMSLEVLESAETTEVEVAEPEEIVAEDVSEQLEERMPPTPVVEPSAELIDYDEDLLPIFLEEAEEILNSSEQTLQSWIENPDDRSLVDALQRQLHTLKGGARMAGIKPVGDLSHSLESTFEGVVEGRLKRSKSMFDLLQLAHDRLSTMLEQVSRHEPITSGDDLVRQVDALAKQSEAAALEISTVSAPEPLVAPAEPELVVESPPEQEVSTEATEVAVAETGVVSEEVAPSPSAISAASTPFMKNGEAYLNSIRWFMQSWEREQNNTRLLDNLLQSFRMFNHSARDANLPEITTLVDAVTQVLTGIRDGHIGISSELFSRMHLVHEQLTLMLDELMKGQPLRSVRELTDGFVTLRGKHKLDGEPIAAVEKPEAEARAESKASQERRQGSRAQHEMVRVRSDVLDSMVNFAGEVSIYRSRVEQQLGAFRYNLDEMDQTIDRLRDQIRKFDIETEAQIDSRYREAEAQGHQEFDPLEFDRFTSMQQISRSMMESLSDLSSIEDMLLNLARESETLLLQQSRVTTELQESLVHTRMVQLVENAPRLRRIVRQTCVDMQKDANLRFQGVEVEMDRTVVERMLAPLEHMLRNAVAHGIESKAAREAAGKPETGTIVVAQSREGSEIVVRVTDDGGGINIDEVRKKASQRGMIVPGHEPSDKELMQFILESGFSTAESLTQVSGRGVGMDVVNSELKQIGATMSIESEFGKGTTFTIRIPLTLSVSRALTVAAGEDIYAIPLMGIQGIERLEVNEIDKRINGENPTFEWVGQDYHLVYLNKVLGMSGAVTANDSKKLSLLLTQSGDMRMAFAVDGLLGTREIVVKSLGSQLSTLDNLSGATILADGSVALILDIPALIRSGLAQQETAVVEEVEEQVVESVPTIMVVDDSITVRKVTERLLKRNNMIAITAKDGVDALAMLQEMIPDVMLLDIEMPRMDGFELATHVRKSQRLKEIPIIMITSRTGEKHRQRGLEIGVNYYMGKPFTESDLLENIQKLLAKRAVENTGE